ncbi:MAG: hypothetical protein JNM84_13000 [Planctomycetes bacterium]|nr:hypothetical protein [Planctomycetota bacterium]
MAGKNAYFVLRLFGEKIGKFKQDVLLPAANATVVDGHKLLSDAELQTVRTGACLTITMTWLRGIMTNKPFAYDSVPNAQNSTLVKLAATAGKVHGAMKKEAAKSSAHKVRLDLAQRLKVPLSNEQCIADTTFDKATNALHLLQVGRGGLISATANRVPTGEYIGKHAMGFHINRQGFLRFFDPNVGEYEVPLTDAKLFFDTFQGVLRDQQAMEFRSTDLYVATLT